MISKNKVVYFGIAFLPDKNALALRASSMAKLARELGYEPIAMKYSIQQKRLSGLKVWCPLKRY